MSANMKPYLDSIDQLKKKVKVLKESLHTIDNKDETNQIEITQLKEKLSVIKGMLCLGK